MSMLEYVVIDEEPFYTLLQSNKTSRISLNLPSGRPAANQTSRRRILSLSTLVRLRHHRKLEIGAACRKLTWKAHWTELSLWTWMCAHGCTKFIQISVCEMLDKVIPCLSAFWPFQSRNPLDSPAILGPQSMNSLFVKPGIFRQSENSGAFWRFHEIWRYFKFLSCWAKTSHIPSKLIRCVSLAELELKYCESALVFTKMTLETSWNILKQPVIRRLC